MKRKPSKKPIGRRDCTVDKELLTSILDQLDTQRELINRLKEKLSTSEGALAGMTARYNGLYLLSKTPVITLERTGRITDYNEDAAVFLGEPATLKDRPFVSFMSRESISTFRRQLVHCITAADPVVFDVVMTVMGREVPVRLSVLTRLKPSRLYFLVTITDRSDVTAAERSLEESVQKWNALVHSAPDTIMLLDWQGVITFANRAWLGYSSGDLLGNELYDFVPVAQQSRVQQTLTRVVKGGSTESCDVHLTNRQGKPWLNLRFAPVHFNGSGTSSNICLLIRDITVQKQSEMELFRTTEMLRGLSARTEEIREGERARIAREIHDELGQILTVLKMDLAWMKKHWGASSVVMHKRAHSMDETLDSLVQKVRRISSELRPPLLDLGLVPAIEWQLDQFRSRAGIRTRARIRPAEIETDKRVATALFRVVQEALTNVARHARASQVNLLLDLQEGELQLSIKDNGRGITRQEIESVSSFGLTGMRERIHHIGGILEIEQMTTGGTCVSVRLPIERLSDQSEERKNL